MSISSTGAASDLKMDYMKLLVTQLQNQNPLEPMDNQQVTAQLTSLGQLEQLEQMNNSFSQVLTNTQMGYAKSLLGKEVKYFNSDLGEDIKGQVQKVVLDNGEVKLDLGGATIGLDQVESISEYSE